MIDVAVPPLTLDDLERFATTLASARAFGAELIRIADRLEPALEANIRALTLEPKETDANQ